MTERNSLQDAVNTLGSVLGNDHAGLHEISHEALSQVRPNYEVDERQSEQEGLSRDGVSEDSDQITRLQQDILTLYRRLDERGRHEGSSRRCKPARPPEFSGDDKLTVENWLHQLQIYFDAQDEHDTMTKVHFARSLLRGSASVWNQAAMTRRQVQGEFDVDFARFKHDINYQFGRLRPNEDARNELSALRQNRTSVREFSRKFRSIAVRITDASQGELLHAYQLGLNTVESTEVARSRPSTLEEAIRAAESYASAVEAAMGRGREIASQRRHIRSDFRPNSQKRVMTGVTTENDGSYVKFPVTIHNPSHLGRICSKLLKNSVKFRKGIRTRLEELSHELELDKEWVQSSALLDETDHEEVKMMDYF